MQPNDKKQFAVLMYGCGEYYDKPLTASRIEIYWRGLQKYSIDEVQRGLDLHMADPDTGMFMPKIADFNRVIEGSKQSKAFNAWDKVANAIKKIGPWDSVVFDDPKIHRVITDMGGWIAICVTKTDKDLEFRMHEFCKRYQAYLLQSVEFNYPSHLIGLTEAENARNDFEYKPPLLIGDTSKAEKIFLENKKTGLVSKAIQNDAAKKKQNAKAQQYNQA